MIEATARACIASEVWATYIFGRRKHQVDYKMGIVELAAKLAVCFKCLKQNDTFYIYKWDTI